MFGIVSQSEASIPFAFVALSCFAVRPGVRNARDRLSPIKLSPPDQGKSAFSCFRFRVGSVPSAECASAR